VEETLAAELKQQDRRLRALESVWFKRLEHHLNGLNLGRVGWLRVSRTAWRT